MRGNESHVLALAGKGGGPLSSTQGRPSTFILGEKGEGTASIIRFTERGKGEKERVACISYKGREPAIPANWGKKGP